MLEGLGASPDTWLWLVFIGVGLVMVLLELMVGVETGLDLVFLGSAFIIGGLVSWPFYSWVLTLTLTLVICIAYIALGRRYVHRWNTPRKEKTNVDAIIGRKGVVLQRLAPGVNGRVRVGSEEWNARAEESIETGETVVVGAVSGVTLIVETVKGGQ